jgi:hypothetical protein
MAIKPVAVGRPRRLETELGAGGRAEDDRAGWIRQTSQTTGRAGGRIQRSRRVGRRRRPSTAAVVSEFCRCGPRRRPIAARVWGTKVYAIGFSLDDTCQDRDKR